jgi:hypothetical protein
MRLLAFLVKFVGELGKPCSLPRIEKVYTLPSLFASNSLKKPNNCSCSANSPLRPKEWPLS